jgi:hypothetical protein
MRGKGIGTGVDLVQHDGIGLIMRDEYLELQGTGLGCQTALAVSF